MPGVPLDITYPATSDSVATYVVALKNAIRIIELDVEDKIVPGEIDWISDIDYGNHANIGVAWTTYEEQPDTDDPDVGSVVYFGGEFYMKTPDGTVKITANGSLNAAAVGGIGGDYGSGSELVSYDSGSLSYLFESSPGVRADINTADIDANGTVDVSGAVVVGTTLGVTGNTTLAGTLSVSGIPLNFAQGTFTPILQNNGVDHATYTTQQGYYTRMGNTVFVQMRLVATTLDPTGTLRIKISSLPVAPSASSVAEHSLVVGEFTRAGGVVSSANDTVGRLVPATGLFITDSRDAAETGYAANPSDTYTIAIGGSYLAA